MSRQTQSSGLSAPQRTVVAPYRDLLVDYVHRQRLMNKTHGKGGGCGYGKDFDAGHGHGHGGKGKGKGFGHGSSLGFTAYDPAFAHDHEMKCYGKGKGWGKDEKKLANDVTPQGLVRGPPARFAGIGSTPLPSLGIANMGVGRDGLGHLQEPATHRGEPPAHSVSFSGYPTRYVPVPGHTSSFNNPPPASQSQERARGHGAASSAELAMLLQSGTAATELLNQYGFAQPKF